MMLQILIIIIGVFFLACGLTVVSIAGKQVDMFWESENKRALYGCIFLWLGYISMGIGMVIVTTIIKAYF